MNDLKANIKFNYLYRDAENYKNWGSVIFENPTKESLVEIDKKIKQGLIDSEFFIAEDVDIPTLYFSSYLDEIDHQFHEYSSIEFTNDKVNDIKNRTILIFIEQLTNHK
jgi:hypothetical protein